MEYRVELSPRAFSDIEAIVDYIATSAPETATRWRGRLLAKIETLATVPHGCSLAPEDEHCPIEVRQTFFGRYRILFTIGNEDALVYVLTVRHGARRFLAADDLDRIE